MVECSSERPCWSDPRDYSDHRVFSLVTILRGLVRHKIEKVSVADVVELIDDLMEETA